jgi:hypothetical protein
MPYDSAEIFRAAASLAALGMKVCKLWGVRDDGSCTCAKGRNCPSAGKHPAAGDGWQHRATDDEEEIARWFDDISENVRWNIGVRLGRASGIIDVEADDENAIEVMKRFGLDKIDTVAFKGSRGPHYLFQFRDDLPDSGVVKVSGLEVRIGGGEKASQSVFPRSWHRTGTQYEWLPGRSPEEAPIAALPDEFLAAVIANSRVHGSGAIAQARGVLCVEAKVSEGGRHAALVGWASDFARQCRDYSDAERSFVITVLRSLNAYKCDPPKSDEEVRKVANDQFDYYRDRRLELRARRPLERYGLEWDGDIREWEPGGWRVTVIHSDPVQYKLRIPAMVRGGEPISVSLSAREWVTPRDVAVAVLSASKRMDLLDPNPARWTSVWNGETIENEEGERRHIRGLRAKLMDIADDDYPPPELKQYCYAASILRDYLSRFDRSASDDESPESRNPNPDGTPKWIAGKLWFKWRETWSQALRIRKADAIAQDTIKEVRQRILDHCGMKAFNDRDSKTIGGRWIVWSDEEIRSLERIADRG